MSGGPVHREEDDIKMDLQIVVCESIYWIDLADDRVLVNAVMKIRISYNAGNFLSSQL
jgi:hypothetical protein